MSDSYLTANQLKISKVWESQMPKNSLHTAPESPIQATNSTQTQVKNLSSISFDTNTGVLSKWYQLAWKLRRHEILQGKSYDTEVLVSKSLANVTLTQQRISTLYLETHDFRTPKIDKTA